MAGDISDGMGGVAGVEQAADGFMAQIVKMQRGDFRAPIGEASTGKRFGR